MKSVFSILVPLLFALFFLSLFGEKIPYNDGAGFDGTFYREVFRNFSNDFFSIGYDGFRIQRIFPFCAMNLVYGALNIPLDNSHMLWGMGVLHIFNLILQVVFFFKLAILRNWKKSTTAILFSIFFFNYYVLKNCGYELFQTDAFAITIALVSYYLLLRDKFAFSFAVSLLGLFTWPTITSINLLLILFRQNLQPIPEENRLGKILYRITPAAYAVAATGIITLLIVLHKQDALVQFLQVDLSAGLLILSLVTAIGLLWVLCKKGSFPFFYSPAQFYFIFSLKTAVLLILPIIAIKIFIGFHTNEEVFFNGRVFLFQTLIRPLKYPAITIAGHVAYFGILLPLILLQFRRFSKDFVSISPGHALAFLGFLFLAIDSEARHIVTFLPIILIPLGSVLDSLDLAPRKAAILVILQLILSHFYIPINVEGLAQSLTDLNFTSDAAQRFFMSFGPWMTFKSYLLWILASFAVFTAIWAVLRKTSP